MKFRVCMIVDLGNGITDSIKLPRQRGVIAPVYFEDKNGFAYLKNDRMEALAQAHPKSVAEYLEYRNFANNAFPDISLDPETTEWLRTIELKTHTCSKFKNDSYFCDFCGRDLLIGRRCWIRLEKRKDG